MKTMPQHKARVLIVDDDQEQRCVLAEALAGEGYQVETVADGVFAFETLDVFEPDVILSDLNMPRMDGFEMLTRLRQREISIPVIVLTGFGSMDKAVAIVHDLKAFWFLEKPVRMGVLVPLLERAAAQSRLQRETDRLNRELHEQGALGDLVGKSAAMQRVFSLIRQVAGSSAAVMITGESGTGKEMVAHEIHRLSRRATGPFVAINCAALPETLMESELFGHEKGAFTGAGERHPGCFEQSNGGTLLLDEIGEMPLQTQSKLLRVLEDLKVRRLGARSEIKIDCRVIAATNRPPEVAIEKKELREDLYYRLNVFRIELPPLRERREDIPALATAMLRHMNDRHGTRVTHLIPSAAQHLLNYDWPGNVRELRNVIERAVILTTEGPIPVEHLSLDRWQQGAPVAPAVPSPAGDILTVPPGLPLSKIEDAYIQLTLRYLRNNRRETAQALGISLRTLQTRLGNMKEEQGAGVHDSGSDDAGDTGESKEEDGAPTRAALHPNFST
jgi:DNA-binding NtrC family response regulator